jgi:ribonucleoside-diphosphate reductase alpha chain
MSDELTYQYNGLTFDTFFSHGKTKHEIASPTRRDVYIKNDLGEIIEKIEGIETPLSWSQHAINVAASKYFRRTDVPDECGGKDGKEVSIYSLVSRVAQTIKEWGIQQNYFNEKNGENFRLELEALLIQQYGAFNSPVWFNLGLHKYGIKHEETESFTIDLQTGETVPTKDTYESPTLSACFIISPEDSIESMMDVSAKESSRLFKGGSGIGSSWKKVRGAGEPISGGGIASGAKRFMDVQDSVARVIKSGGKTRRAAVLQCIDINHPDVVEVITHKFINETRGKILIKEGAPYNWESATFQDLRGQNVNISIRVDDEFMKKIAKDEEHEFIARITGKPTGTVKARNLLELIAYSAYQCGDPGIQYDTTINEWHTCPNSGRIEASNPCSEFMFINDSACNLASLNLLKFRKEDGSFDVQSFRNAVKIFITAQDILVSKAGYPSQEVAKNSHEFRPLGLGYANLGAYCMTNAIPYDSDEARHLASVITSIMTGEAYLQSTKLAQVTSPFKHYELNKEPMINVIEKHKDATKKIPSRGGLENLVANANQIWGDVVKEMRNYGARNAQITLLAPTGTIGFLMGCTTTGCEPEMALVKYKNLSGGGTMTLVNDTIPIALKTLGYNNTQIQQIEDYIKSNSRIEDCPLLNQQHVNVFDCAFRNLGGKRSIDPIGHVKMLAAIQPFISGAISKTVNLPDTATVEDIYNIYVMGANLGLKSIAVYRDGSKGAQVLETRTNGPAIIKNRGDKELLPIEREAKVYANKIGGTKVFIITGEYPINRQSIKVSSDECWTKRVRLGEIFINCLGRGSEVDQLINGIAMQASTQLQYGVPLREVLSTFEKMGKSDISGFTDHPYIKTARGVFDFVNKLISAHYLGDISFIPKGNGHELRPLPNELRVYQVVPELHLFPTVAGFKVYPGVPSLEETINNISGTNYWLDNDEGLDTRKTLDKIARVRTWSGSNSPILTGTISGETCNTCGTMLIRNGSCKSCPSCATVLAGSCGA